jgi:hephaestin
MIFTLLLGADIFTLADVSNECLVFPAGSSHPGLVAKPFEKVTYLWTVPPHAGPTAQDPACLTWMYFSAADPIRDTNSGLVSPLLVCKANVLGAGGKQVLQGCLAWKPGRKWMK